MIGNESKKKTGYKKNNPRNKDINHSGNISVDKEGGVTDLRLTPS